MSAFSVECMVREPDVLSFADAQELWAWLANHHETQHGGWVQKAGIVVPSIGLPRPSGGGDRLRVEREHPARTRHDVLLAEVHPSADCRHHVAAIADRLEAEGRMTPAGRRALNR